MYNHYVTREKLVTVFSVSTCTLLEIHYIANDNYRNMKEVRGNEEITNSESFESSLIRCSFVSFNKRVSFVTLINKGCKRHSFTLLVYFSRIFINNIITNLVELISTVNFLSN